MFYFDSTMVKLANALAKVLPDTPLIRIINASSDEKRLIVWAAGSPARHADAIKAPVLLFHGDLDRNVGVGQSRMMADKLREAGGSSELIVYDGLDHQLDDSASRTDMMARSAAFLSRTIGADRPKK